MSHLIRQDGFSYAFDPSACATCQGRCCTGESGNIFVSAAEVKQIATLLECDIVTFYERYLIKRGYKFSLREKRVGTSHDCIFFDRDANGCGIYQARPQQCRTFPFWEYFKTHIEELQHECPGVRRD